MSRDKARDLYLKLENTVWDGVLKAHGLSEISSFNGWRTPNVTRDGLWQTLRTEFERRLEVDLEPQFMLNPHLENPYARVVLNL
jgi:hypothetical protein